MRPRLASLAALLVSIPALAAPLPFATAVAAPTSPESFLGHPVGADRKLADWGQIVRYFEALDRDSDRVMLLRLGSTTLGRPLVMAAISSPENLRQSEHYRDVARRLADPRLLAPGEAERLTAEGRVILLVTCSIHSNEIGASQMAMEWAWQLATSDDAKVKRWLDDVILLLVPSINPDGIDMVVDWYRKNLGTPWEGGRLPWLYHHYAGHDDNRDWYMLDLVETRLVNRVLHHDWFPQVFLDEHQMGTAGPRIFVPPYADPLTPLVHPLQWRFNDLIGTQMALRLEQAGKSGVIYSYSFDAYWPGGTKNTACLKNVVGLLTEVASARVATPVYVDPGELRGGAKGLPEYKPQVNFPNPWPGGSWRLRDVVDYELVASNSLLETCSSYRQEILRAFHDMGKDAVERGRREAPSAYVVPAGQRDPMAAAELVDILRENGLEAERATSALETADGRRFPAGSIVFPAAQPYRPFLLEMMERQRYLEVREGPDTREVLKPYDVTAWTLPLLMGVDWTRVDAPLQAPQVERLEVTPWPAGGVRGEGRAGFALAATSSRSAQAVNRLLAGGAGVERALEPFDAGGERFAAGTFLIAPGAAPELESLGRETHLEFVRLAAPPGARRAALHVPRLGLYKSFAASADEGWTRFVLDRHEFKYTSLDNTAMKQKGLRSRFDVIVLPDLEKDLIVDGKPRSDEGPQYFDPLPPPYDGGIGKEGVDNLREFVEQGGTLVCLGEACGLPLGEFNLPVRDVTDKLKGGDYSLPGTLVNLDVDPSQPLGFGMPERCAAYYTSGPVFATSVPGANVGRSVVARFPQFADQVVASGWAAGTQLLAGRAALVEARLRQGRVVLFGLRPQHRAQTVGTYKLFFNALYLGGTAL